MPTLIVNHKVKDYTSWKTAFDSDSARLADNHTTLLAVGEKAGDPNNVYIVFDVTDISKINAMMADPELQAKMQEAGVISQPEVVVIN